MRGFREVSTLSDGFCVLFDAPEPPPLDKTAAVLARFFGGPLFDAQIKARRCRGFLGENLSEPDAARLAGLAAEAGFAVVTLPAARLAVLPRPEPVHWLRAFEGGMAYTVGTDAAEKSLSWDRLRLLAAAGLKESASVTKTVKEGPSNNERMVKLGITLVTGIPMGGFSKGKEVKKVMKETEISLFMDLFAAGDSGLSRLHVDARSFNYASLGEPLAGNAFGNFRLLLQSVDRFAGPALRTRGARDLLAGKPAASSGYEERNEYEKELVWTLSLMSSRP